VTYGFAERMAFSKGRRQESDLETLKVMFPGCSSVVKTCEADDRAGTDYVITLRGGARLKVDAKARDAGCSMFWERGPEVALETWNVMPGGKYRTPRSRGKVGWTRDDSKEIDLILFTFDPADHLFAYVRPLPLLREAFRRNCDDWWRRYEARVQESAGNSGQWQSECVFVPLLTVDQAIEAASRRQLVDTTVT
jgi:hypothetical protein